MSQAQQILEFMRHEGPITPLIALKRFGSFRLASRIKELREDGWLIKRTMVRRGEKRYASYSLAHVKEGRAA